MMNRVESRTDARQGRSTGRPQRNFGRGASPANPRARGRRGESLTSARDRERLRERERAERERVEGMLATVPLSVERRVAVRDAHGFDVENPVSLPIRLRAPAPAGCPVCGDSRVVTDEVMNGGTLRLAECLHCDHRWTERLRARWAELGTRMHRQTARRPRHGVGTM